MNKKALGHTTLIIILSVMIACVIAVVTIISQTYLIQKGFNDNVNVKKEKLLTNLDIVRIFVDGTQDGQIDGGDNITIISRVLDESGVIDIREISVILDGSKVLEPVTYNYSVVPIPTGYTVAYLAKGQGYKLGFISPGDVVAFKIPVFTGLVFKEMERIVISVGLLHQGKIVPYGISLPAALSSSVTILYPFS